MGWNFVRKFLGLPSQADEYIFVAMNFFCEGKLSYARTTLNLALECDPGNKRAKDYMVVVEKFIELEKLEDKKVS